ncbi:unnamed protein product [Gongylonema pulchrum]|uniref:Secreted protein n=1 Tax=Gongylonema pulchrum TaxID=637853 RepID=A0A183D3J1_9BILA|nr:unnamed protein product [Gongylonema pulchrum]
MFLQFEWSLQFFRRKNTLFQLAAALGGSASGNPVLTSLVSSGVRNVLRSPVQTEQEMFSVANSGFV